MDPSLTLPLKAFRKASVMWNHMKKLYHQTNKARRFHLDTELVKYCQNDKTVQQYYSGFLALWTKRDQMLLYYVSTEFLPHALKLQEELHVSQFLMNLCSEFEPVWAALMNRENSPGLDTCPRGSSRRDLTHVALSQGSSYSSGSSTS